MGQVFDFLNKKEVKKNILEFGKNKYNVRTNFKLLYFILERQNEMESKNKKDDNYNAGYDSVKTMLDFIKIAVSEKFYNDIMEADLDMEDIEMIFNVVVSMATEGLSEKEAFEKYLEEKDSKKK